MAGIKDITITFGGSVNGAKMLQETARFNLAMTQAAEIKDKVDLKISILKSLPKGTLVTYTTGSQTFLHGIIGVKEDSGRGSKWSVLLEPGPQTFGGRSFTLCVDLDSVTHEAFEVAVKLLK